MNITDKLCSIAEELLDEIDPDGTEYSDERAFIANYRRHQLRDAGQKTLFNEEESE